MINAIKKWFNKLNCQHKWLYNFYGHRQEGGNRVFVDMKTCYKCDKVKTKYKIL